MADVAALQTAIDALKDEVGRDSAIIAANDALLRQLHDQLGTVSQAPDLQSAVDQIAELQRTLAGGRAAMAQAMLDVGGTPPADPAPPAEQPPAQTEGQQPPADPAPAE